MNYSLQIIEMYKELKRTEVGRTIGRQLLRSGTSIGANVHEAQGGQSRADFIAKMSIAHKEAYETAYWLAVIRKSELVDREYLISIEKETMEIIGILSAILITMKRKTA